MKKLLLGSAVIALGLGFAAPAKAEVKLGLGGYFKGYVSWVDQDEPNGDAVRNADIIRDTEVHFTGETTLDNGLTVGAHIETDADGGDGFEVDESYAYFSGAWGRVNFGNEDGAAYLLQVAAPSADSNVDGIRQYVSPINYTALGIVGLTNGFTLDYANDFAQDSDKVTYLTPVFSGFQAGVSYTPDTGAAADSFANSLKDDEGGFGDVYEAAVRYEGSYRDIGFSAGGGYTFASPESNVVAGPTIVTEYEDFNEWNAGLDLNMGPFGLGAVYTANEGGVINSDSETWVVGGDYTTGPYKLGVSYLTTEASPSATAVATNLETDRYSAGLVYTYGPGLTFRGSIGYVDHEVAAGDADATYALVGTQIEF